MRPQGRPARSRACKGRTERVLRARTSGRSRLADADRDSCAASGSGGLACKGVWPDTGVESVDTRIVAFLGVGLVGVSWPDVRIEAGFSSVLAVSLAL